MPTARQKNPVKSSSQGSAKTLEALFHATLKDIYYAEKQILKALPKMAEGAESEELAAAFEKHRAETEGQVERLTQVFDIFGKRAQGKTCPAIDGIKRRRIDRFDRGASRFCRTCSWGHRRVVGRPLWCHEPCLCRQDHSKPPDVIGPLSHGHADPVWPWPRLRVACV